MTHETTLVDVQRDGLAWRLVLRLAASDLEVVWHGHAREFRTVGAGAGTDPTVPMPAVGDRVALRLPSDAWWPLPQGREPS